MGYSAKTLAQHLRARCLRELGDSTKHKYAPGDHFFELSNVFRGAPIKAPEEGVYHFTISEEIKRSYQSDTQWRCVIYVTPNLDIFMDEIQTFEGSRGSPPAKKILKQILSCAVRGRD